ncbi:mCG147929 [Mus musculus]|nr:mCG147929 [Mus musculus]
MDQLLMPRWSQAGLTAGWQGAVLQPCLPIKQLFTARPSVFILQSHSIRHSSITVL